MQNKTSRLVGLFAAAAMTLSAGCSSAQTNSGNSDSIFDDECLDENNDGYCDDDGTAVYGSSYIKNGKKYYKKATSGITSGSTSFGSSKTSSGSGISSGTSASKGGIGSSGGSSTS
jgi:hypothetical protein